MKPYKKIFIWENIKRTNELISFRDLIVQYFGNAPYSWKVDGRIENDKAVKIRNQINLVISKIRSYIKAADVQSVQFYTPAPLIGGFSGRIDILSNIFKENLGINHKEQLDIIDRAMGVYLNDKVNSWIRTFNPFFWIYLILDFLVTLPFKLLGLAGFNQVRIENSLLGKIFKIIFSVISVGAAFLTILEKLGYLESFKVLIR